MNLIDNLFFLYAKKNTKKESIFKLCSSISRQIIKDLLKLNKKKNKEFNLPLNANWFVFSTFNNYRALKNIKLGIPNSIWINVSSNYEIPDLENENIFSNFKNSIRGRKYFSLLFYFIFNNSKIPSYIFLEFHGIIDYYILLIKKYNPNVIFISNDHYPSSRGLIIAAFKLGIKCVYIQHASVSKLFLPIFNSHSFLYGRYSLDVYSSAGKSSGAIYLVGNHNLDSLESYLSKEKKHTVGIALNLLDSEEGTIKVIKFLRQNFPDLNILLRKHPRDKRSLQISNFENIEFSLEPEPLNFLAQIDVLIAGDSSIHLEAVFSNVISIYYRFNKNSKLKYDYYDFLKNDVVYEAKNSNTIGEFISMFYQGKLQSKRNNAKYFEQSIDSDYEFNVTSKIIEIVKRDILE